MARTKKDATKTTVKTASVSETPAKSVVTASEEKAVKAETPKTDDAKASVETKAAEKKVEEKTAEAKSAEEKTTAVKAEEPVKKTAAKKTTTRKTAAKKTETKTTRKTAAKKTEPVTEVYVQYWGNEIHTSEVAERIKKIWTEDMGKKASDLKDLKIYIKPEDNGAHYVINGDVTGFIGL